MSVVTLRYFGPEVPRRAADGRIGKTSFSQITYATSFDCLFGIAAAALWLPRCSQRNAEIKGEICISERRRSILNLTNLKAVRCKPPA
jgi:hypothetical protein